MAVVLILDDAPTGRELLVTLLAYAGHQTLEAAMGDEALALIRAEKPDLVISDMLMPRMDGYEFARELRGDPEIAHTRLIFYSATYDERELERLAQACGAARILEKPADPADILSVISDVLAQPPVEPGHLPPLDDREHQRIVAAKLFQVAEHLRQIEGSETLHPEDN